MLGCINRMVTYKRAALTFLSNDERQAMTMYPGTLALCFKEAVDHLENMWRKTEVKNA